MEQILLNPPENLSYETLWEISEYLGYVKNKGAEESNIRKLKTFTYRLKSSKDISSRSKSEEIRCCICLTDFAAEENLKEMPCRHYFHAICLDTWLKQNGSCPICRSSIISKT
jgi:hypothetical protein